MTPDRRLALEELIADAGLPRPEVLQVGKDGRGIAVGFRVGEGIDTIEGCGSTDAEAVASVAQQFDQIRRSR
jgi:hypothetical protein